jgi:hypothetical protein
VIRASGVYVMKKRQEKMSTDSSVNRPANRVRKKKPGFVSQNCFCEKSPLIFFKNLKPLGGGWDSILLVLDINIFWSLSLYAELNLPKRE